MRPKCVGSNFRRRIGILLTLHLAVLSGCALQPEWQRLARSADLEKSWSEAGQFRHLLLWNRLQGDVLYVYIEGDGSPWINGTRVAVDPTPVNPVMLRLMTAADHPAVYIGRPCYFGTSTSSPCKPDYWTFSRYGTDVVDSMCAATNEVASAHAAREVVLIAYSGGAAIAVGMKTCVHKLSGLVTIAGNLDPPAWTEYHGYSPLVDLPDDVSATRVRESHWQCVNDEIIPPATTDRYFLENPAAERHVVDGCAHASGWDVHWNDITH